jgi:hypothetical protein
MQYIFWLTTFFSLSSALPIHKRAAVENNQAPQAAPHPGIATLNYVSTQLATVIAEINQFDWRNPRTDTVYRHAMETLETLKRGNKELRDGPQLDILGTIAFGAPLISLNLQIHQMTAALKNKKPEIDKAKAELVFYSLLKSCYTDSLEMRKWFVAKQPSWISSITNPIIDEVVNNIAVARDLFKPKEGDMTVVIVTEPGRPNQQQSQPQEYGQGPQGAPITTWGPNSNRQGSPSGQYQPLVPYNGYPEPYRSSDNSKPTSCRVT